MSGAWGYTLRRLTDEEVAQLVASDVEHTYRCKPDCRRCTVSICVAGKCRETGRWRGTYRYITGRQGRVSFARRLLCDHHAEQWRRKHDAIEVEGEDRKHALEGLI